MAADVTMPSPSGGWSDETQVNWYLERMDRLAARRAGEQAMLELVPAQVRRVLDLGCGDGRLAALVLANRPSVERVTALDSSAPMLRLAEKRFAGDSRVTVHRHDLRDPIKAFGTFDLVVSGFAIHHLEHHQKQALYQSVTNQLTPGGVFLNLEVVASATPRRHAEFLAAIGRTDDDPEDRLSSIEDQLSWMRHAGLGEVDCLWRWRGFALLVGEHP